MVYQCAVSPSAIFKKFAIDNFQMSLTVCSENKQYFLMKMAMNACYLMKWIIYTDVILVEEQKRFRWIAA